MDEKVIERALGYGARGKCWGCGVERAGRATREEMEQCVREGKGGVRCEKCGGGCVLHVGKGGDEEKGVGTYDGLFGGWQ